MQLDVDTLPNQRHRATVGKLLVHTATRRRGIGEALMVAVERTAADAGRWLLTLRHRHPRRRAPLLAHGLDGVRCHPGLRPQPGRLATGTAFYWKELPH